MAYKKPFAGERLVEIKKALGLDVWLKRPTDRKIRRWTQHGVRGVKLESHREGGTVYTSIEAVERFLKRTNPQ